MRTADAIRLLGGPRAEALARAAEREERAREFAAYDGLDLRTVRVRDVVRAWERGVGSRASMTLRGPRPLHEWRRGSRTAAVAALADALVHGWIDQPPYVVSMYGANCERVRLARRLLDRAVSVYGADTSIADVLARQRARAERTDHQVGADAPISDGPHTHPIAATHGGDGNSGECDHFAATSAANRQPASDGACTAGAAGDTPDGTSGSDCGRDVPGHGDSRSKESDAPTREDGEWPAGQGDQGSDEETREMGAHCDACRVAGDHGASGDRAPAQTSDSDRVADSADATASARPAPRSASVGTTASADSSAGGRTGPEDAGSLAARASIAMDHVRARDQNQARRLVAAMRRLVETTCATSGAVGPRYDGRKLIRELASRRYALHRARRAEVDIRDLVIAVDQSMSCAPTVAATYEAAMAAAHLLPRDRVAVILHSNGRAIEPTDRCPAWLRAVIKREERGLHRHFYSASHGEAAMAVWREIAARRPGLVLMLGDMDSADVHDTLHAAGVPVLLMTWIGQLAERVPYKVVCGVVDLASAAAQLEAALTRGDLR